MNAQTGYFTIIDTLSEMEVTIGQSILVFGQDGVNCGGSLMELTVGNSYVLSLYDYNVEKSETDTFYLHGCGTFYLKITDTEFADWTKEQFQTRINEIVTNTEEVILAEESVTIFPNPSSLGRR